MSTTPESSTRASLLAYAPWIMRDYLMQQGLATAIVMSLLGVSAIIPLMSADGYVRGTVPEAVAGPLLARMAGTLSFLGAFFATNGIVANDRKLGYYKFLFSKPVRPWQYYGATFLLYGGGLLAVTAVLALIWGWLARPTLSLELLALVALMYVAYGGVGFLLSAAWRFDWLSLVSLFVIANIARAVWATAGGWRHWVLYLLPPVHRTDSVFALLAGPNAAVPWTSIAWAGGYGLLCFLLGLVVVHQRPLGTS